MNAKLHDILKRLGLTADQFAILAPHGPDSPDGYPGAMIRTDDDGKTWAEREKEKDDVGYSRIR